MSKKVIVTYSKSKQSVSRVLHQYDYGQVLVFEGEGFPELNEFHFSNEGDIKTTVVFGNNQGVRIPDKYLKTGKDIIVYAYSHVRACDGESVYKVLIPVEERGAIEEQNDNTPIEYIFDGKDASYEDETPCKTEEYIFDGRDASDT